MIALQFRKEGDRRDRRFVTRVNRKIFFSQYAKNALKFDTVGEAAIFRNSKIRQIENDEFFFTVKLG